MDNLVENWLGLFSLILFGALVNLIIAFAVFRALARWMGIPPEDNDPMRALATLLTVIPAAGVAGAPFFLIPFMGPPFGIFISGSVAAMMVASRYGVAQSLAAKIILPTVAVIYVVSGAVLYYGIPMI